MIQNCQLPCINEQCPRKRRVAKPDGYCRYQITSNSQDKINEGKPE